MSESTTSPDPTPRPPVQTGTVPGCGNCLCFHRLGPVNSICRARPPIPVMIGMRQGRDGHPTPIIDTFWPAVLEVMWCRCWTPKTDDLAAIDFSKLDVTEG